MSTNELQHADPGAGDPKASGTLVAAVIGALAVIAIVIALEAFYVTAQEGERGRKVVAAVPEELIRVQAGQLEKLNGYRMVDAARGVVAVPIDRAVELTVRDQGRLPAAALPPASPPPASPSPEAAARK